MSNRYTGEVEAQDSWKITLQPGLSVSKCYVTVGDEVKKGDKLFSYNTEELKLNLEKKELEVETMTNEINQLKKDIAGFEKDLKGAKASEKIELQTQILTAQTTIKKDEFTIKSSKEEIKTLKKNIKDATIKSKMDGVVKKINASLGSPSTNSNDDDNGLDESSDNVYMTILALGDYRVKGTVSESNVSSLSEGAPVIIRSRMDEDRIWKGTISAIKTDTNAGSENSENSENTDTDYSDLAGESAAKYYFYVKLEDDTDLMMGQHVLVELDNGQENKKEGIWLNSAYLHIEGDDYYVWAANNRNRLTLRKVTVGDYDEVLDEYQILKGLSVMDYITSDSENLRENMRTTKNISESDSTEYYNDEMNDDDLYTDDTNMDDMNDDELFENPDGVNNGDVVVEDGVDAGGDEVK
jgi:HlyD family secretion protein